MAKKIEISSLHAHIGYRMRLVSNTVSHTFARKLENTGVTVAEWVVLREMYARTDRTSPHEIAELTSLTRGAISKLITRLLDKKLVSREESGSDRRYQDIALTDKGSKLVPKLTKIADQNDADFFSCLSNNEKTQLKSLLQKIADHHQINTIPTE